MTEAATQQFENEIAADEAIRTAAEAGLVEVDTTQPLAVTALPEITAIGYGEDVTYLRHAFSDLDILGVLAHCRKSIESRIVGGGEKGDLQSRVITHLWKATKYLELSAK